MKCLTYSEGRREDCTKWYIMWVIVVWLADARESWAEVCIRPRQNAGGDIQRAPLNQKSREFFTLPEHDSCRQHVRVVKRRERGRREISVYVPGSRTGSQRSVNGNAATAHSTRLNSTCSLGWLTKRQTDREGAKQTDKQTERQPNWPIGRLSNQLGPLWAVCLLPKQEKSRLAWVDRHAKVLQALPLLDHRLGNTIDIWYI